MFKGKAYGQYQDQAQPQELVALSCVGSKGSLGWNCVPQAVKYQLNALVASDPENNTPLIQHYEG